MGQQQLLLLVLSTVIVGLATVAGIQAFSEGQTQATQDALTQRGISIGQDISAALNKPDQLGGISQTSSKEQIAAAAGLDADGNGEGIPADGAGNEADCDITGTDIITITCAENGSGGSNSSDPDQGNQTVTVETDQNGAEVVSINGTDIGSI